MLNESYREVLTAVATCAAGLTGLLFVAMSVAPREGDGRHRQPHVIQQVRAASALVAFINALSVSLFGLVPGSSAGQAALALASIGILFTGASVRSIVTSRDVSPTLARRQAGLVLVLLAAFGAEFGCGIGLITHRTSVFGPGLLCDVLIAMLLIGIARAWELVGDRDTGIISSLAVLVGHGPVTGEPAVPPPDTESSANPEPEA
ncbi:MAG TPA: hypothetical protein VHZ33_38415 [Trebonia sp.]|nr:hypothetical protein [Trebonia sp.]